MTKDVITIGQDPPHQKFKFSRLDVLKRSVINPGKSTH
jgi:hypothetical protein